MYQAFMFGYKKQSVKFAGQSRPEWNDCRAKNPMIPICVAEKIIFKNLNDL
jgi:hypothetical protein